MSPRSSGRTAVWFDVVPLRILAACLCMLAVLGVGKASAQLPPESRWSTIESENFRVTFAPGLEELARHAARRAESAHLRLRRELAPAPAGKIDIVLTDYVDLSNGYATPFPSNRIVLYARPPIDLLTLGYFDDWIDLLVTHELAHIFHLDQTSRLGGGLRRIFGRVPVSWPFFPNLYAPTWAIEGLATHLESHLTGSGRVHGTYYDMVLRTAILEGGFDSIDRVNNPSGVWPGGHRPYIYGSHFLAYLSERYGPEAQRRMAEAAAGAWMPPSLNFDRVARKALGRSFTELYDEWRRHLESRYGALADSLHASGVTATERVGDGGYNTLHPRVGPRGEVAWAAMDGRSAAANVIHDPVTGRSRRISRRNGVGPISWFADGALLTAQPEFEGPHRIHSDLYRIDERGEHRLTRGARLSEPDLAHDQRRVVAVEGGGGTNRLVIHDLETAETRALTSADPKVHWASPRWAPEGDRIAAVRWEEGRYEIVVLDTLGVLQHRVGSDRGVVMAPAWSPDGRYLIFSSDRTWIPNLYACDLGAPGRGESPRRGGEGASGCEGALLQVTNLLTGAFYQDVSPDGRWIYFSAYHADGFHVERIPYDPSAWRPAAPMEVAALEKGRGVEAAKGAGLPSAGGQGKGVERGPGAARPYSPLHSLLPRFWLPTLETDGGMGAFLGAWTGGADLVGRHAYTASAGYSPGEGVGRGRVVYAYAGLGQPIVELSAARQWDGHRISSDNPEARLLVRDDELRATLTLQRRTYRSSARFSAGAEWLSRRRLLRDAPGFSLTDPSDRLVGMVASAGFANHRSQPLSISPEDGAALSLAARRYRDIDPHRGDDGQTIDRGYDEVSGQISLYKGLDLPGYANHVLAWRLAARWRGGPGAAAFGVGGGSGTELDIGIDRLGEGRRLLPVRGFPADARYGTLGWSSTLEYRFPVRYLRRGPGLWPLFIDRLAGALFLDAGDARCGTGASERIVGCSEKTEGPIVSAGAELYLDAVVLTGLPLRIRGGAALPLRGEEAGPRFHLLVGLPF